MTNCPTCGQEVINQDGPIHDVARRTVSFNGEVAAMGFAANLIFEIMLRRYPATSHWESIACSVWAGIDVDWSANFRTQACKLRKALKPLGIAIPNNRMGHYWLEW